MYRTATGKLLSHPDTHQESQRCASSASQCAPQGQLTVGSVVVRRMRRLPLSASSPPGFLQQQPPKAASHSDIWRRRTAASDCLASLCRQDSSIRLSSVALQSLCSQDSSIRLFSVALKEKKRMKEGKKEDRKTKERDRIV